MSTPERRFFFCHLQKTAGTTLIRRIRGDFPARAVYPLPTDGDPIARVISVENLLSVWAKRGHEIQVVTGHFPLCTAELLSDDFTTLTVLRHPLERTVSYMRHHRRRTPEDAHLTLEEVYDDEFRFHGLIHNHMTKMLSLAPAEMDDGALTQVSYTRERLERAKERLAGVDVVGIQANFESFCRELSQRFGWSMADPLSPTPRAHGELPSRLRDRILEDNAHDVELYEFARRLVDERAQVAT